MKKSGGKSLKIGLKTGILCASLALGITITSNAMAQNYQRITTASMTPAPQNNQNNNDNYSRGYNGQEAASYAYGYSYNMPSDGKWRFIEERCYNSAQGNTCVGSHWIRRVQGRCEETTSHSVRTDNYIRIVPAGRVSTCRD